MSRAALLSRVEHARRLTDVLDLMGYTPDDVLALPATGWYMVAVAAELRQRHPVGVPDDATKTLVWHRLTERRRLDDANPLVGLSS